VEATVSVIFSIFDVRGLTSGSLLILTTCHYRSYHHALQVFDKNIALSKTVIWQQVSICYSLLSITWPFSKSFINSFDTAPLEIGTYGSGAGASGTGGKQGGSGHGPWSGPLSTAACTRATLNGDNESVRSQGSQGPLVIMKNQRFAVIRDHDGTQSPQQSRS
jgi:hypothetical protein